MKLYSFAVSPYAARARIAIYAKKLPVEIVEPQFGGLKSPEYLGLNPMGKVPVLVLDDGGSIPESETIVEYLEDAFPNPALRPNGAEAAARVRLIARVAELYVMAPVFALFPQLQVQGPDADVIEAGLKKLDSGIDALEHFMPEGAYAAGDRFTTADCAVTPTTFFLNVLLSGLDRLDLMNAHPRLAGYMTSAKQDPVLAKVLGEMAEGLKVFRAAQAAGAG